ncbi:hypothetical protein [Carboxylicivirga sp. M1479]|uniref:hypothetical protein n=1 Tax=Carboxylicivirga sp. M1479 TaxID=2594476 RepID=UPI00117872C1|nr:hypothetical protein [Carboxylicivirga sp. M1479]TRX71530.1 hypothetical protein FNN09_06045 [Carboxylicivirga sp. M1479]
MDKKELLEEFISEFKRQNNDTSDFDYDVYVCDECLSTQVKGFYDMAMLYHNNPSDVEVDGELIENHCDECGGDYVDLIEVESIEEYKKMLNEKYGDNE